MKPILLGILPLLFLLPLRAEVTGLDWMKSMPDGRLLSELSIPGTHDSGARFEPVPGTAKCQDLPIAGQLNAGVRFLDIRCRHLRDAFVIHHGPVYQNLNFDGVLDDILAFLKAHPSECVILSIKEESSPAENTRGFEQTFDSYVARNPDKWLLKVTLPTMAEARGKIILLRRFNATSLPKGIAATGWADNATFSTGVLRVQGPLSGSGCRCEMASLRKPAPRIRGWKTRHVVSELRQRHRQQARAPEYSRCFGRDEPPDRGILQSESPRPPRCRRHGLRQCGTLRAHLSSRPLTRQQRLDFLTGAPHPDFRLEVLRHLQRVRLE